MCGFSDSNDAPEIEESESDENYAYQLWLNRINITPAEQNELLTDDDDSEVNVP